MQTNMAAPAATVCTEQTRICQHKFAVVINWAYFVVCMRVLYDRA